MPTHIVVEAYGILNSQNYVTKLVYASISKPYRVAVFVSCNVIGSIASVSFWNWVLSQSHFTFQKLLHDSVACAFISIPRFIWSYKKQRATKVMASTNIASNLDIQVHTIRPCFKNSIRFLVFSQNSSTINIELESPKFIAWDSR